MLRSQEDGIDIRAVADDTGNVTVRDNVDDAVVSAIIVDSKNALVVYPQLPQTPLQKFTDSDRIVGLIRDTAGEKRWDRVLWAEMMLSYNTAYWMTLFGRGPKTPDGWDESSGSYDADHIFIKFIMDNVNINHERADDIKKSIVARYMSLSSGYEIRDLKAPARVDVTSRCTSESSLLRTQSTQAISRRTRSKSQPKNAWQSRKTLTGWSSPGSCAKSSVELARPQRTVAASHRIVALPRIPLIP